MNSSTNFATGTAQGAAVAHTYQVGAIVSTTTSDVTPGFILSSYPDNWYGILFKTSDSSYSYALCHASEFELAGEEVSLTERMKLKLASMILRKPVIGHDYMIMNIVRNSHE